jgi:hypothetical protein
MFQPEAETVNAADGILGFKTRHPYINRDF